MIPFCCEFSWSVNEFNEDSGLDEKAQLLLINVYENHNALLSATR